MRGTVNVRGASGALPAPAATPTPTPQPTPIPPIIPEPGTAAASIVDFAFDPAAVQIATGTTVTWANRGQAPHTVTATDGSFDSGMIAARGTYARTFDTPGTFAFACTFHPDMTGTVVVSATSGGAPGSAVTPAAPTESPVASESPATAPLNLAGDGNAPPAAAGPTDTSPASTVRDGALRLLIVALLTATAVIAFGLLIGGTARNGRRGARH